MKRDAFRLVLAAELEAATRSAAKHRMVEADARIHIVGWLLEVAGVDDATFKSWLSDEAPVVPCTAATYVSSGNAAGAPCVKCRRPFWEHKIT